MASQEEANARASDLTARTLVHHLSSALIKEAVDLDPIKAVLDLDLTKEAVDLGLIKKVVEALDLIKEAVDSDLTKAAVDLGLIKEAVDSGLIKAAVEALDLISVQAKAGQEDSAHLDVDKALVPADKAQEEDEALDPIVKVLEALVRDKETIHGTTIAMMTTGTVTMEVRFENFSFKETNLIFR